ncbi:MAG: DNA glycosylase AlkZ-like family protein [Thermoplasmata archaeon]
MPPESIDVARRFVLGRQGLWPGRRWEGRRGLLPALRYIGSVQYDPLDVVGHSHDLALWGRIVGYVPAHLDDALYRKRTLFETAGNVQIHPIEEWPFLRIVRERRVVEDRWRRFARSHSALLARVERELDRRGPLGPADFRGPREKRIRNYRAGREAGLALYFLWLKGDVMIAFRRREEKVFDLTSRLRPRLTPEVAVDDAEEHLILGTLRCLGLATGSEWLAYAHTRIARSTLRYEWAKRLLRWREDGVIAEVEVGGWKGSRWLLSDGLGELETLRASEVPSAWRPRSTTTDQEAVFLAPLEFATARGRSRHLFDFDLSLGVERELPSETA